jgi:hypothetical protein
MGYLAFVDVFGERGPLDVDMYAGRQMPITSSYQVDGSKARQCPLDKLSIRVEPKESDEYAENQLSFSDTAQKRITVAMVERPKDKWVEGEW